jgi:hypothetical protein
MTSRQPLNFDLADRYWANAYANAGPASNGLWMATQPSRNFAHARHG